MAHDLEITFDGERILLERFGGKDDEQANYLNPTAAGDDLEKRFQIRMPVKAGPHAIGVAFLKKSSAPTVELLQPFQRERIDPITPVGIPELDKVTVEGPFNVTGPGDSPSRRRIFTCKPADGAPGVACARTILSTLARRAYRRPLTDTEMDRLLGFYQSERTKGGSFDAGIENALAFVLVSPQFLFRFERDPDQARRWRLSPQRSRAGVAPVLLHLEQHSRRSAAEPRRQGQAEGPGRARAAGEADARRSSARARSAATSPASGCTCAT